MLNIGAEAALTNDIFATDQLNEIKGAPVADLVAYAYMKQVKNKREELLRFEARRKLMLMFFYSKVEEVFEEIIQAGKKPLNDLENTLHDDDPQELRRGVRTLVVGKKRYRVTIENRVKSKESLLRKMFVPAIPSNVN